MMYRDGLIIDRFDGGEPLPEDHPAVMKAMIEAGILPDALKPAEPLVASYMIDGEPPTGCMFALVPEDPSSLALEDGEPPEVLHITLKFLGDADDWDGTDREELLFAARQTASEVMGGVPLTVTGVEMFGENEDAVALEMRSPAAVNLHKQVHDLTPQVDLKWPEYRPHLTLKYVYGDDAPDLDELRERLVGQTINADRMRLAFGEDVVDFPFNEEQGVEVQPIRVLTAASEPARSAPDVLTDAEIEQRRQAALASAEARRKKAMNDYEKQTRGADARTRADTDHFLTVTVDNKIKGIREKLKNPNTSTAEREALKTELQIELENKRAFKMKQAEIRMKIRRELAQARADYASAERVLNADRMRTARSKIDALEKEAQEMELGDELYKINVEMQQEQEKQWAKDAAEARRAEEKRQRDIARFAAAVIRNQERERAKAQREAEKAQRKREQELARFFRELEKQKDKKTKKKRR